MREKLIELLGADTCKRDCCEDCEYCANTEACIEYLKTSMADHLIANGVTIPVRCKDCDFRIFDKVCQEYYCNNAYGLNGAITDNTFCSYGERRTDE